jgi:hypothetical protein
MNFVVSALDHCIKHEIDIIAEFSLLRFLLI